MDMLAAEDQASGRQSRTSLERDKWPVRHTEMLLISVLQWREKEILVGHLEHRPIWQQKGKCLLVYTYKTLSKKLPINLAHIPHLCGPDHWWEPDGNTAKDVYNNMTGSSCALAITSSLLLKATNYPCSRYTTLGEVLPTCHSLTGQWWALSRGQDGQAEWAPDYEWKSCREHRDPSSTSPFQFPYTRKGIFFCSGNAFPTDVVFKRGNRYTENNWRN